MAIPSLGERQRLGREGFSAPQTALALALVLPVAAFLTYMAVAVSVVAPRLPPGEALRHWPLAAFAALIVVAIGIVMVATILRRRRGREAFDRSSAGAARRPLAGTLTKRVNLAVPPALHFQRIPRRVVLIGAVASFLLLVGAAAATVEGFPLWAVVALTLLPWVPLLSLEIAWKAKHYGFYAVFTTVVLLQVGHLGEHFAQVAQLLLTNGALAHSHGVFGRLDFETVHFVWVSGIWLGSCALLAKFSDNRWLWVSFLAASIHEVEHVYLFWIYLGDEPFYLRGGFTGILGLDGVIGSPLARPYLHFAYNFVVVVAMVVAFWHQSHRVSDRFPGKGTAGALRG